MKINRLEYFRRIRPINLLIIGLTQSLFYFLILVPTVENVYPIIDFLLASIITMIVAASGYLINDILDINIDIINKPEKISVDQAIWLKRYVGLVLFGMVLNVVLCAIGPYWWFIWVYPLACFMMYLYSSQLKCQGLIGNLLVAGFSAGVVGILLVPIIGQMDSISLDNYNFLINHFIYYFILGFMISLVREIVKDVEDLEGDKHAQCQTLPVKTGIRITKYFIVVFMIVFILALLFWTVSLYDNLLLIEKLYLLILVLLPSIYLLIKIYTASTKQHFAAISNQLKYLMFSGICYILIAALNF